MAHGPARFRGHCPDALHLLSLPNTVSDRSRHEHEAREGLCDLPALLAAQGGECHWRFATMNNDERKALEEIASVLDKSLGDSDITHLETDEEIRDYAPVQWACSEINKLLQTPLPEGLEKMQAEVARLQLLINTPELEDFDKAVPLECAHQIERWGDAHDRSKSAENWYWLVGYLAGKALRAAIDGDREKSLHHTISAAAALRNWHRAIQQDTTGAGLGADADLDAIAESTAEFKR